MLWLFLLVLVVALVPLVRAMIRASALQFVDAHGQVVAPEEVPKGALKPLKEQVEPLLGSGFEYLGMMRETRREGDYWQAFLTSAGGRVWAVAEESDELERGRRVSLFSFGADGSIVVTRDGDSVFGEELPRATLNSESFASAAEQAASHAELLDSENVSVVSVQPDVFLARYQKLGTQGLDSLFERGLLQETDAPYLSVPLVKLPHVGLAMMIHDWGLRARKKKGKSWLLDQNLGVVEPVPANEPEPEPNEAEATMRAESAAQVVEASEPIVGAPMPSAADLAANAVEPAPVSEEKVILDEEKVVEDFSVPVPDEDGLSRDWALYQNQASKKSWAYWLGGFGGRTLLFLSLLIFSIWMAQSAGWGMRMVCFGLVALVVHEVGHAVLMLLRRSWDWSHFLLPFPRPLSAKRWSIGGGFPEFLVTIAGPLPGLVFGWFVLVRAYLGVPTDDLVLDAALAAVVVNGFTLLPFLPLDGGRLLDLAFLRRMPGLRTFALFVTGGIMLVLALLGGGLILGVLAVLMWIGIPAARRKSKLLPWLQANSKDDEDAQVITAYSVARERSVRKSFKGRAGIARLDELIGLGRARKLGGFGVLLVLGVLAISWLFPFVLPAVGLAKNGQAWFEKSQAIATKASDYLGPVRGELPANLASLDEAERDRIEDAYVDLEHWRESLAEAPSEPEKVFSEELDLNALRVMDWQLVAGWISGAPRERQLVAREAARAMRREAIRHADEGNSTQAFRDLSAAIRITVECEPRHSLDSWVLWREMEREITKEVEDVSSRYPLSDNHVEWFEGNFADYIKDKKRRLGPDADIPKRIKYRKFSR